MNDVRSDLIQNLHDAGLNDEQILDFLECTREKGTEEQIRFLRIYRRTLMDDLHETQRRVDGLDYLVYKLEKEQKPGRDGKKNGKCKVGSGAGMG